MIHVLNYLGLDYEFKTHTLSSFKQLKKPFGYNRKQI